MAFMAFATTLTVQTDLFTLRRISASNMIVYMPFFQSVSIFFHELNRRSTKFDVAGITEQSKNFSDDYRRRHLLVPSFQCSSLPLHLNGGIPVR